MWRVVTTGPGVLAGRGEHATGRGERGGAESAKGCGVGRHTTGRGEREGVRGTQARDEARRARRGTGTQARDRRGERGYQISGWRSFQGRAASSWADSEIRVPSSPIRPASMTPMGSPASVQCSGTFTAG